MEESGTGTQFAGNRVPELSRINPDGSSGHETDKEPLWLMMVSRGGLTTSIAGAKPTSPAPSFASMTRFETAWFTVTVPVHTPCWKFPETAGTIVTPFV